jgi:hypothetical protein
VDNLIRFKELQVGGATLKKKVERLKFYFYFFQKDFF